MAPHPNKPGAACLPHVIPFAPRPFHPAAWLPGPHPQTIAGKYLRTRSGVRYRRERLELADGDFLDLDFVVAARGGAPPPAGAPVALVVHGLEGSSDSGYVRATCRALWVRGIAAVAMNFRSCSGAANRLPRLYHAGETGDLGWVLEHLAARFPGSPLAAVGFSLGANVLLKYLGERGAQAPLAAAAAISIPFDLGGGADKLDGSPMGRLYTRIFIRSLTDKYLAREAELGERCDRARVLAARSFRSFDDAATAPIHGFAGVDDYYTRSSCGRFLPAIRVPTLLVHAADDPFVPADAIPAAAIGANRSLAAAIVPHGGHVGFLSGPPWAPRFWAEDEAARFIAVQLGTALAEGAAGGG